MYLNSEGLLSRIREIAAEADRRTQGRLRYEEHIALPAYGQIILRFTLEAERVSPDELDRYEALLYEIVGDEFLIDFMGSVYRRAGADLADMDARFAEMAARYADEKLDPSVHAAGIRADAAKLLEKAGLSPGARVWEIQADGDELLLLVFGKSGTPLRTVDDSLKAGEVDELPCLGLFRAAVHAKKAKVSLARVLLDPQ